MGGYLINFIVYTIAMIGLIFVALVVYKKTSVSSNAISKSKFLKVEDTLSLAPRKQLFVVRAGNEKFLVASDADRTTLISKLETTKQKENIENNYPPVETYEHTKHFQDYDNTNSAIKKFAKRIDL